MNMTPHCPRKDCENGNTVLTVLFASLAIALAIGGVVYAVAMFFRRKHRKENNEKWSDYDECGIM